MVGRSIHPGAVVTVGLQRQNNSEVALSLGLSSPAATSSAAVVTASTSAAAGGREAGAMVDDGGWVDLLGLPDEIALHILSFLDGAALAAAGAVSRGWRRVANDPSIWRKLVDRTFASAYAFVPPAQGACFALCACVRVCVCVCCYVVGRVSHAFRLTTRHSTPFSLLP